MHAISSLVGKFLVTRSPGVQPSISPNAVLQIKQQKSLRDTFSHKPAFSQFPISYRKSLASRQNTGFALQKMPDFNPGVYHPKVFGWNDEVKELCWRLGRSSSLQSAVYWLANCDCNSVVALLSISVDGLYLGWFRIQCQRASCKRCESDYWSTLPHIGTDSSVLICDCSTCYDCCGVHGNFSCKVLVMCGSSA